jgi:hypothetical protein
MGVDPREFAHDLGVELDQLVAGRPPWLLFRVAGHRTHGSASASNVAANRLEGIAALQKVVNHVCPIHADILEQDCRLVEIIFQLFSFYPFTGWKYFSNITLSTTQLENEMNKVTYDIAALLKINLETALKVQHEMESSGFDFSECTQREFNKEVRQQFLNEGETK